MSHYDKPCRNMKFEAIKKTPQRCFKNKKKAKRFALLFAGFNQIDYLTNSLN